MDNTYYDTKFDERQEELEELVQMQGMTPYQVIGYYIEQLEQIEYTTKLLVEYIGKEKAEAYLAQRKGLK